MCARRALCSAHQQSIVTAYASYVVEHAARTLEQLSARQQPLLLQCVLDALRRSFQHDQDGTHAGWAAPADETGFWQAPAHFGSVVGPLAQQLGKALDGEGGEAVIAALTSLAVAASAENHKELNARLLPLMRAEAASARLAAVRCQQSLTRALGEEWLGLLAEMLPFIGELREDDDEMVERETQRWINAMEQILGEDMDAMLQ